MPTADNAAGRADRIPLLGLAPAELRRRLAEETAALGEPAYRTGQITGWVYERHARGFDEMTNLPERLRRRLAERMSLTPLEVAWEARSEDGTTKHLWRLADDQLVESVLIPAGDRVTLCLSSQVGCALGCRFCATGDMGFRRQLAPGEIVAQFRDSWRASRELFGRGIANVVYMGMGEPFANLDAVLRSLEVLHHGFGLGARRITVSTVGLVPGIRALAARPEPFRLAVSLHAPNSELRASLVPVERRWPLPELLAALRAYREAKGRRISFEYTLMDGVNDAPSLAEELATLASPLKAFVNLIPCNPVPGKEYRPSPASRVTAFAAVLERRGVPVAVREPRGRDIAAACGQLHSEREAARRS